MLESLRAPCDNSQNSFCNQNVHAIIHKMLEKYPTYISNDYIGGLFDAPYHVFENKECVQYIQEYLPFHFPQIETAVTPILQHFMEKLLYQERPIRILDIGSGPATVPLVFCREFDRFSYPFKLSITTLEASVTFNKMIDMFNDNNLNKNIIIINKLHYDFYEFIGNAEINEDQYDWVIISNFITGIGIQVENNVDKIINILTKLVFDLMVVDKYLYFTFIETNSLLVRNFYRNISFATNNICEELIWEFNYQKSFSKMMECKYYKYNYLDHYKPYIITKTMRLKLT